MLPSPPYVLLDDQLTGDVRYYDQPVEILRADSIDEIGPVFERLNQYHKNGYYLAGYCAYELGYALEMKLATRMPHKSNANFKNAPLFVFGVFKAPKDDMPLSMRYSAQHTQLNLKPNWSKQDYLERFNKTIAYIKAGDIYQANLTFPLTGAYAGAIEPLYAALRQGQPSHYGGIVSLDALSILSFSPELFFKKTEDKMSMRPMKGTRPRDTDRQADTRLKTDMQKEPKSRAENLMIVDLLRNDLSRISIPGSVKVPELFSVETYPTLHQMISKIESQLSPNTPFQDIFKSLFPCGSVTGAPKIRAMEIIRELETAPRGAYCGAMGYIDPNGDACFNVGIRTLTLSQGFASYGIGSGVVLDSDGPDEYRECLLKARILTPPPPVLIETLRWDPDTGFKFLALHLARLKKSARALKHPYNARKIRRGLDKVVQAKDTAQRLRLTLSQSGEIEITASDFEAFKEPLNLIISRYPLSNTVQISHHKLSSRGFYDGERKRVRTLCGADEVLFVNEKNELCEGAFTALFIKHEGQLYTPPLSCGLLPSVLREALILKGEAIERVITLKDILDAEAIYVGKSMRGLMQATLISSEPI